MLSVEYEPGGSSPIHRHDAHAFVYVLEGAIVMQVKGGRKSPSGPGEPYCENPTDIHLVSRNASNTQPAKFINWCCSRRRTTGRHAGEVILEF